jgi:O-antigen/teichoic acid export membrane protein
MSLLLRLSNRFKAEFASRFLAVIFGAILTVILARLLGPDSYGLFSLALSVLAIAQIFSRLGIAQSAARYVTEYKETDDGQVPHVLKLSFLYILASIGVVSLVLAVGHQYFAILLNEPDLTPLLLWGSLLVVFATLKRFVRVILQGFESIQTGAVIHSLDRVLRFATVIALVTLGYGALGALFGYILALMISSCVGLLYVYANFYHGTEKSPIESGIAKRILEYALPLTATNTGNAIDRRFDSILVGLFVGPVGVAYYAVSKQIVNFVRMPVDALGFTLAPTYKSQQVKGNTRAAARMYEEALSHGLLVYIPAVAGIVLIAEPLVQLIFGSEYFGAVPVLRIMAVYALLLVISSLTSGGLDYLGRARERAIIRTVSAVGNVVLNVILIPRFGVEGAAIATVTTYSIYTFSTVYLMLSELELKIDWLFRRIVSILIITGVMSGVVLTLIEYIGSVLTLFLVVLAGLFVWAALSIMFGLLDIKEFVAVIQ